MSAIESPSTARRSTAKIQPRHPHLEIAELLATALLRMRAGRPGSDTYHSREVGLALTGSQSVHTNPSDMEGVRK
jgi:hypothetical protein